MKQTCLLLLLALVSIKAPGQNIFKPEYFQPGMGVGSVLQNHPAFPEGNSTALAGEFRFGTKLNGSKPWHKSYRYAEIGLSVSFGSIGNAKVLGNFFSVIPELAIPLKQRKIFSISSTLGMGAAYFDKPYDQVKNPENVVIGSHFTFCAIAGFNFAFKLRENISLCVRPVVYHSSNSHSNLPNVGMNLPVISLGLKYAPSYSDEVRKADEVQEWDKKIHVNTRIGLAYNEQGGSTGPTDGPKYPIYLASAFFSKKVSIANKIQTGIEGWYNTGVYDYITSQDFFNDDQKKKSMAIVWFFGHEFLMGHFSVVTQGGIYLYNPFYKEKIKRENVTLLIEKMKTIFPARIGLQYYLFDETTRNGKNLFVGIYIKTNLGQADFLDMGIGYNF